MKKVILAMVVSALFAPAGLSAATPDVAAPIRQFIDGFNTGDLKSAFDAYSKGDISIIDEFAPYRWLGPNAAHGWADDFQKMSDAEGSTDGKVSYGKPRRTEIKGDTAYVIIPTVYTLQAERTADGRRRTDDLRPSLRRGCMEDRCMDLERSQATSPKAQGTSTVISTNSSGAAALKHQRRVPEFYFENFRTKNDIGSPIISM